jgi:hypothetical protein
LFAELAKKIHVRQSLFPHQLPLVIIINFAWLTIENLLANSKQLQVEITFHPWLILYEGINFSGKKATQLRIHVSVCWPRACLVANSRYYIIAVIWMLRCYKVELLAKPVKGF